MDRAAPAARSPSLDTERKGPDMSRLVYPRYVRKRKFSRVRHGRNLLAWLDAQSTRLSGTGMSLTFVPVTGALAVGTLTLTGNLVGEDFATGILTLAANAADTETVTIGTTVYTFQASLVDSANNVLIGATASDSIDNLVAAITAGAGAGTLYGTGTAAHPDVTAVNGAGDTMDVTANVVGAAANSIATTETGGNMSFGNATLTGGLDADTVTVGDEVYTIQAALVDAPNNVLEGATANDTVDNLVAAINGAAGAGTTYGTGTPVNALATAANGGGDTLDATAVEPGTIGNAVVTLESSANASWGGGTLSGGVWDPDATATTHGLSTGDGPYDLSTTGVLPSGLTLGIPVYVINVDANTIAFALSEDAAEAGLSIPLGSAGSGTHTATKGDSDEAIFAMLQEGNKPTTIAAEADVDNL